MRFRCASSALLAVGLAAAPLLGNAQSVIRMLCKGDLETLRDGMLESKSTTVDAKLDVANEAVELEGFWGCLADLGNRSPDPSTYQCVGKQKLKVSEDQATFFAKIDGPLYYGQTHLLFNRFTATMTVYSHGISKPASNATWKSVHINGKLLCAQQDRKF